MRLMKFFVWVKKYWWVLSIGTVCYLAALPLGWMSYREHQRRDAAASASQSQPAVDLDQTVPPQSQEGSERPARLN